MFQSLSHNVCRCQKQLCYLGPTIIADQLVCSKWWCGPICSTISIELFKKWPVYKYHFAAYDNARNTQSNNGDFQLRRGTTGFFLLFIWKRQIINKLASFSIWNVQFLFEVREVLLTFLKHFPGSQIQRKKIPLQYVAILTLSNASQNNYRIPKPEKIVVSLRYKTVQYRFKILNCVFQRLLLPT